MGQFTPEFGDSVRRRWRLLTRPAVVPLRWPSTYANLGNSKLATDLTVSRVMDAPRSSQWILL